MIGKNQKPAGVGAERSNIKYTTSLDGLTPDRLTGFFVGWRNPLGPDDHLRVLRASYRVVLAIDEGTGQVVGFINAISDGLLSAYIPLLEVLPEFKYQGIGTELVRRLLHELQHLNMVDLSCDDDVVPFYQRFGMFRVNSMSIRRFNPLPRG